MASFKIPLRPSVDFSPAGAMALLREDRLPMGSNIISGMRISHPVIHIPDCLRVYEGVAIDGEAKNTLQSIGDYFIVHGDCDLSFCVNLRSIGAHLTVDGSLNVTGAEQIAFGHGCSVNGDIYISKDMKKYLPSDFMVVGKIICCDPAQKYNGLILLSK